MTLQQNLELFRLLRKEYANRTFTVYDVAILVNEHLNDIFEIDNELSYFEKNGPYPSTAGYDLENAEGNKKTRSALTGRLKPIRTFVNKLVEFGYAEARPTSNSLTYYSFIDSQETLSVTEFMPLLIPGRFNRFLHPTETTLNTWMNDKTVENERTGEEKPSSEILSRFEEFCSIADYGLLRPFETHQLQVLETLQESFFSMDYYHCETDVDEFLLQVIKLSIEFNGIYVYGIDNEQTVRKVPFYDIVRLLKTDEPIEVHDLDIIEELQSLGQHPLLGVRETYEDMNAFQEIEIVVTQGLSDEWSALGLKMFSAVDYYKNDAGEMVYLFSYDESDMKFARFLSRYVYGIKQISSEPLKHAIKTLIEQRISAW